RARLGGAPGAGADPVSPAARDPCIPYAPEDFPPSLGGFPQFIVTYPHAILSGEGGNDETTLRGSADSDLELGLDLAAPGLRTTPTASARQPGGDHHFPGRRHDRRRHDHGPREREPLGCPGRGCPVPARRRQPWRGGHERSV